MEVGTHEVAPIRLVKDWYSSWASGSLHWELCEPFADRVADAGRGDGGRIGAALYHLHVMKRDAQFDRYARRVKDWAYQHAAEFVASRRGPARFRGYALDWGHQAARDGLYRALWEDEWTPGRLVRAEQFGCGERPYARLRDYIQHESKGLLAAFESDLSLLHGLT